MTPSSLESEMKPRRPVTQKWREIGVQRQGVEKILVKVSFFERHHCLGALLEDITEDITE